MIDRLLSIADRLTEPARYRARMRELAVAVDAQTSDEFELAGTGRCFRGYTSPVVDPAGRLVGRVWTLREVTADRELDRMRDAFVATVSHELRTPLTSISGFLEMMEDEEHGIGDTGRTYLEVIRRSTDRLHGLVEDLLLIAQIEKPGGRPPSRRRSRSSLRSTARRRCAATRAGSRRSSTISSRTR